MEWSIYQYEERGYVCSVRMANETLMCPMNTCHTSVHLPHKDDVILQKHALVHRQHYIGKLLWCHSYLRAERSNM